MIRFEEQDFRLGRKEKWRNVAVRDTRSADTFPDSLILHNSGGIDRAVTDPLLLFILGLISHPPF